jgi:hypothetical protein
MPMSVLVLLPIGVTPAGGRGGAVVRVDIDPAGGARAWAVIALTPIVVRLD